MKFRVIIRESKEKIPGGLGANLQGNMEAQHRQIAKIHGVPVEEIEAELQKGIEVEMEHTSDQAYAHEIAMDHLIEDPKYYTKLDTIEEKKKRKKKKKKKSKGKKDACYRKVKSRYDTWPSAYASGALVKCRKVGAKNWGNSKKNEELELDEVYSEKQRRYMCAMAEEGADRPEGLSQAEAREMCEGPMLDEAKKKKAGTESSKENNLRDWFKRKGAKGKKGGWVDCNAPDGKGGYKSCGRAEGEKRSKYPSCRPPPGACKEKGKGKSWGKKSAKGKKG